MPEPGPLQGVTAAVGFAASGLHCGLRRKQPDLALVVCDNTASAAACFTTNRVQAAPIQLSRRHLQSSGGWARAIVANSGNANACTGSHGLQAARCTADETARLLGIPVEQVLVASTGVIGQMLPVDRLVTALPRAVGSLSRQGGGAAATAILTTDTCIKETARTVETPSGSFVVGGMAKGSGMIHPDMATTLAFVTTDAAVYPALLQGCLRLSVEASFNRISVDGDTSTNDMVAVLAGGASGIQIHQDNKPLLQEALTAVLTDLAKQVVRDGEGATKLIALRVGGAENSDDALKVARTVAGSLLVKTAAHGADANWGRIAAAAGRAGIAFDPERLRILVGGLEILGPGYSSHFSEAEVLQRLQQDEITIDLDLGQGKAEATVWTCDLSEDYVRINATYRT